MHHAAQVRSNQKEGLGQKTIFSPIFYCRAHFCEGYAAENEGGFCVFLLCGKTTPCIGKYLLIFLNYYLLIIRIGTVFPALMLHVRLHGNKCKGEAIVGRPVWLILFVDDGGVMNSVCV